MIECLKIFSSRITMPWYSMQASSYPISSYQSDRDLLFWNALWNYWVYNYQTLLVGCSQQHTFCPLLSIIHFPIFLLSLLRWCLNFFFITETGALMHSMLWCLKSKCQLSFNFLFNVLSNFGIYKNFCGIYKEQWHNKKIWKIYKKCFLGERDGPLVSLPTTNSEVYK